MINTELAKGVFFSLAPNQKVKSLKTKIDLKKTQNILDEEKKLLKVSFPSLIYPLGAL